MNLCKILRKNFLNIGLRISNLYSAFTLAEVLITLGIIGVVASLTIPTVVNNFQKLSYVSGLKKQYSAIQQAFKLYMADQGTLDLSQTNLFSQSGDTNYSSSTIRQNIWDSMMKKYFKTIKSCNVGDASCNYKMSYLTSSTDAKYFLYNDKTANTKYIAYFPDGAALSVSPNTFSFCKPVVNPYGSMKGHCGNFTIDVNGPRQPNKAGRDIFYFILSPDGNLHPDSGMQYSRWTASANDYWKYNSYSCGDPDSNNIGANVGGIGCAARIIEDNWQMNY